MQRPDYVSGRNNRPCLCYVVFGMVGILLLGCTPRLTGMRGHSLFDFRFKGEMGRIRLGEAVADRFMRSHRTCTCCVVVDGVKPVTYTHPRVIRIVDRRMAGQSRWRGVIGSINQVKSEQNGAFVVARLPAINCERNPGAACLR